jgi:hypothetical protein
VVFPGKLDDAFYRASPAFVDLAGNSGLGNFEFAFLWGDINDPDNIVGFGELIQLAANYNKVGMTYTQGNLDYDPEGRVDFDDLLLLAARYNWNLDNIAPPIV